MKSVLLSIAIVVAARGLALAQTQDADPAQPESPDMLAAKVKEITDYLVAAQKWRKEVAAKGGLSEEEKVNVKQAEAIYIEQRAKLLDAMYRLHLWARFSKNIDNVHPVLTNEEIKKKMDEDIKKLGEDFRNLRERDPEIIQKHVPQPTPAQPKHGVHPSQ